MLRLFYGNQSYALFLAPLLVILYFVLNTLTGFFVSDATGNIELGLWGRFSSSNKLFNLIVPPTLIMVSGAVINFIYNRNEFFDRNTFLPVLLYITSSSFFPHFYVLNGFGIALMFQVLSLYYVFQLNQNDDARALVFNAAFFSGIGMTLYPPLTALFPLLFFVVWIFRPFVFRETLMLIIGTGIPFFYAWVYLYLSGKNLDTIVWSTSSLHVGRLTVIAVSSGILLFLLLSMPAAFQNLQRGTIRLRKIFNMLIVLGISFLGIVGIDYFYFRHAGSGALLLIPLMFVIPYAFGQRKLRTESEVLYYLLFGISVSNFFLSMLF